MKLLLENWRNFLTEDKMSDINADQAYSTKVRGINVIINLKDTDLEASKHSKERQFRHDEKISNQAIIQAVEMAIGKIIQDFANGELANDEPFHIRMVGRGKVPALNVIAVLDMRKGPDTIKVITVMRRTISRQTVSEAVSKKPTPYIPDETFNGTMATVSPRRKIRSSHNRTNPQADAVGQVSHYGYPPKIHR